jgi:hypothetical protein
MTTIDQRGCGKGKTTQRIYKRIQYNIQHNIKTLVVVPGLQLQKQYIDKDTGIDYPAEIINSKVYNKYHYKYKSTVQALMNAMSIGENIIIVTHKTFTLLPKDNGYKNQYDLIIDEALEEVVKLSKVTYKKTDWDINFNLAKLFSFENETEKELINKDNDDEDANWTKITIKLNPGETLLNDSESFNNLIDPNYMTYVTSHGWKVLTQVIEGEARIINVLDPHLIIGWYDVLIAAAAFKYTKMYYWLKTYNIEFNTVTEFEPHNSHIRLHTDKNIGQRYDKKITGKSGIIYSNTLIKKYPQIIDNYHEYINQHRTGKIITIRNNHQDDRKLPDEEKLSHNVHGLNDYQHITNVNLESALNMDPHIESFYRQIWLTNLPNKYEKDKMILHFHSSYLFYQVIMRTSLRSMNYTNQVIDVFTPDLSIASSILDYFNEDFIDNKEMNLLKGIEETPKSIGRPIGTTKSDKMTPAERAKKYRDNKKNT